MSRVLFRPRMAAGVLAVFLGVLPFACQPPAISPRDGKRVGPLKDITGFFGKTLYELSRTTVNRLVATTRVAEGLVEHVARVDKFVEDPKAGANAFVQMFETEIPRVLDDVRPSAPGELGYDIFGNPFVRWDRDQ